MSSIIGLQEELRLKISREMTVNNKELLRQRAGLIKQLKEEAIRS